MEIEQAFDASCFISLVILKIFNIDIQLKSNWNHLDIFFIKPQKKILHSVKEHPLRFEKRKSLGKGLGTLFYHVTSSVNY